jgi:hypothetical protein
MKSFQNCPPLQTKPSIKGLGGRRSVICTVTNQKDIILEEENMKCKKCTAHYKCNSCNMKTNYKILSTAPCLNSIKTSSEKVSFIKPIKNLNFRSSLKSLQYNITELSPNLEGITSTEDKTAFFKKKLEFKKENYEKTKSFSPPTNDKIVKSQNFKLQSLLFSDINNRKKITNKNIFVQQDKLKLVTSDTKQSGVGLKTNFSDECKNISKFSKTLYGEKNYLRTTLSRTNYSNTLTERNSYSIVRKKKKSNYFSDIFCSESPKFCTTNLRQIKIKLSKSLSTVQTLMDTFRSRVDQQFNSIMEKLETEFDLLV